VEVDNISVGSTVTYFNSISNQKVLFLYNKFLYAKIAPCHYGLYAPTWIKLDPGSTSLGLIKQLIKSV